MVFFLTILSIKGKKGFIMLKPVPVEQFKI